MSKNDKELTVEVVTSFLQSWFSSPRTAPVKIEDVNAMITSVYTTIHSLPTDHEE